MTTQVAWTDVSGKSFPEYFNATLDGDEVFLTVRAPATIRKGVHICSHRGQAGPGRCVAGGPTCNNYCNMAPEKGPMQDHPLPCEHVDCGPMASMRMPKEQFAALVAEMVEMLK